MSDREDVSFPDAKVSKSSVLSYKKSTFSLFCTSWCNIEIIQYAFKCEIEKSLNILCKAAVHWYPHDHLSQSTQHNRLWSVFIRDPNKAISHHAATGVVITESIRDVQTPQIPFLWETYWKRQKTNGSFGSSDSWRCTFLHLPQITWKTLRLWCANKPKANVLFWYFWPVDWHFAPEWLINILLRDYNIYGLSTNWIDCL